MPSTNTERMKYVAEELDHDGHYTMADSVIAATAERDALHKAAKALYDSRVTALVGPDGIWETEEAMLADPAEGALWAALKAAVESAIKQ